MLNLDHSLKITPETIKSANLCDKFTDEDLNKIGSWVHECYARDKESRRAWSNRTEGALELAMQVQKDKTFPWQGCSNILFPLVTIAAMQFHARAYPAIINGKDVVQCRVIGEDPEGIEKLRATKISEHMSWQLLEQDESWEEEMDRALLNVAIVGCGFKKTYYNPTKGHNVSPYVHAKDLVFDYWAKSVDSCPTKTHIIPMYRNEIYERVQRGQYRDILDTDWYKADATIPSDPARDERDNRTGTRVPSSNHNTPFQILEQHCWLDLDDDGYAEPYIITIEEANQAVLRIVTRFDRIEDVHYNTQKKIISIDAWEYFTKIPFIPSPDGGILDKGFGTLLGPLNESVDSAINQLFDAGTMSNTAGGFLGRGAKIRGGVYQFKPFEWNRVDSSGDDLRKNLVPLPVREPSAVMFNLLSLIIDFTGRISGATDMMVGENPGQNTPAETSRTMMEQGQKIYSAIFKRVWRSMKGEFKKLYVLNSVNLPVAKTRFGASGAMICREDYAGTADGVVPVADPTIASDAARYAQAMGVKQLSIGNPAYDADGVEIRVLKALGVQDIASVYKGVANAPPPAPDVKLQIQSMKTQADMAKLEVAKQQFIITIQETARLNNAKILELSAQAFRLQEEGKNVEAQQKVTAFRAAIELMREQNKQITSQLDSLMEIGKNELESGQGSNPAGAVPGMESAPGDFGTV